VADKFFVLILALVALVGCDAARLKTAVPDILEAVGATEGAVCEAYQEKGRGIVESAWSHDWPVFAPIFERETPDPVADEIFCRGLIEERGAAITVKPGGSHSSTALVFAVFLAPDFQKWDAVRRARVICHEAHHIVWQHRVGLARASADYVSVSGRLASEAAPYALGELQLLWYGVDEKKIVAARQRRAKRFPATYKLTRTVSPECVFDHFTRVSDELRRRVGPLASPPAAVAV
jgi:hypothetical protein